MRLIDADSIKFTEYVNGDVTVSKEEIQNMPTIFDVERLVGRLKFLQIKSNSSEFDYGINKAIEVIKIELKQH